MDEGRGGGGEAGLRAGGGPRGGGAGRVVVDPALEISPSCRLVTSANEVPTVVACGVDRLTADTDRVRALKDAGVEIIAVPRTGDELPIEAVLRELVLRYQSTHVMVEAGAGLLGRLFRHGLVNEAWVFIAPLLFGDEQAVPCVRGLTVATLTDGSRLELWNVRRRGDDVVLRYGVSPTRASGR